MYVLVQGHIRSLLFQITIHIKFLVNAEKIYVIYFNNVLQQLYRSILNWAEQKKISSLNYRTNFLYDICKSPTCVLIFSNVNLRSNFIKIIWNQGKVLSKCKVLL